MQRAMDQVSQSCYNYDLTISTKTQRLYTNQHLESTLSRAVYIDDEVTARIAEASVVFGRLCTNVWERNGIKPESLHGCDTANPLVCM